MIFVDCNGNKTLQSWFEFFKEKSSKKIKKWLGKKSLDYHMYEKSF